MGKLIAAIESTPLNGQSSVSGVNTSEKLLYVTCKINGNSVEFLVDTGSAVTVIPYKFASTILPTNKLLTAANDKEIKTYGTSKVDVIFKNLRRKFHWQCYVAGVVCPIIGADFLEHHDLIVHMKSRQLIDNVTKIAVNCISCESSELAMLCPIQTKDANVPDCVAKILRKYSSVTEPFTALTPALHSTKHHIVTSGHSVSCKPRPLHGEKLAAVKEEFRQLQELGVIRPSNSPWASPVHLVPKGNSWRIVGDYRRLNQVTEKDAYPMSNITSLYSTLYGKKVFSNLDLVRGYNQIAMEESSIAKTAVATPFGLFEYTRMPFGLRNASQTFQRFMNELFNHLDFVFVYIDDVLIFSEDEEQHEIHLETVFKILQDNSLKIGLQKCSFFKSSLKFLGHVVSASGIKPSKEKCAAIQNACLPETYHELHQFLGSAGYYRKHIPHFAELSCCLYELLNTAPSKNAALEMSDSHVLAFEKLKMALGEAVEHSFIDPSSTVFTITSDASKKAIGAVLHQLVEGRSRVIQFYSRKLSDTETRYSTFDRELLAAHDAVQFFLPYVDGRNVTVYTDQRPLTFALKKKSDCKPDRQARQLSFLSEHVLNTSQVRRTLSLIICLVRLMFHPYR